MSKMIQIRNVPDQVHRILKARAASEGMSLSDYLLTELKEIAERPTLAEMRSRLEKLERLPGSVSAAELIREERDAG
jgi:antitoxin FitA